MAPNLIFFFRNKVEFGVNTRAGCIIRVTRQELSENCQRLRTQALNILVGAEPSGKKQKRNSRQNEIVSGHDKTGFELLRQLRVASFGNSRSNEPQDWIEIEISPELETLINLEHEQISGECRNMVTDLHISIHYAYVGSQANPQAKIIGVYYKFSTPKDIIFQCNGLNCRLPNATQGVQVSTSVGFIDMTQPASAFFREKPVLEAKLPHDFFYPFIKSYDKETASSSCPSHYISKMVSLVSILVILDVV